MDVLIITFEAVAILLGIGFLGFWIIGRRHVPANAIGFLTSLAIDIALPALVLANILTQFSPQDYTAWWQMPLWWIGFTSVAIILSLTASFMAKKEFRREFAMSLLYQNGIFFPLIILTGIFGSQNIYLTQLFLFIFLQPTLVFSTYTLFFRNRVSVAHLNWRNIINPVLVFTLIGVSVGLLGIKHLVPDFMRMILVMMGAMATPLFMLILGGNVYQDLVYKGDGNRKIYKGEIIKFILVKNLIFPLVFIGLMVWLRPEYSIALILVLQAAVPPITAIPIFAERCGGNRSIASQFIVASFLFSIISIPAVMFIFSRYFPFP